MPQLQVTKNKWDKEFSSGQWDYLDVLPAERARSAVIGMYCRHFSPAGKILDVGCGLGTTVDFLNQTQKKKYLGLDISSEAVKLAEKKKARFQIGDFADFKSKTTFDIIIFNEVLYYLDETAALKQALSLLAKNGCVIVSLYRMRHKNYDKKVWQASKKLLTTVAALEITGTAKKQRVTWYVAVLKNRIKKRVLKNNM